MNKKSSFYNRIISFLLILTVAWATLFVLGKYRMVCADPLPRLSDRTFRDALTDMTAEYDKDVSPGQAERNPYISERLILRSTDRRLDPEDYGAVDGIQDRQGNYILQFESAQAARKAALELSREESTIYVEPDGYLYACSFTETLDEAQWEYSPGLIGAGRYAEAISGFSGSVEVAVLDTGISFTSPKLSGRLDKAHAKSFSTDNEVLLDVDQSKEDSTVEKARHGTHVAGIVAQCTEGLTNIRILPVRVLDNSGQGKVSQVAAGIRYAAEQGAKVINLSLSGKLGEGSETLKSAIDYAISLGSVVVVVAGNNGQDISAYTPGNLEECVVVGGVNGHNTDFSRMTNSNYGSTVDVVAPGDCVYSTSWENHTDGYNTLSGTSMAAPHVSAAAAMIKLAYRDYGPEAIEQMLKQHVRDLGSVGRDNYYGYGMIDLTHPADNVTALISELDSPVGYEDRSQVESARAAYNGLSDIQKSLVTNLSVLEEAEELISALAEVHEAAESVMELITDLPLSITLADKTAVEYARAAYDALTDAQKAYVTNLDILDAAESAIARLEEYKAAAQPVIDQISTLPSSDDITLDDKAAVEAARAAYDALTDDQKAMVDNLRRLSAAETRLQELIKASEEEKEKNSKNKYPRSDPKPNVTYRVPLKKKQKTNVLTVIGLADGDKVISWKSSNKKKAKVTGQENGTCLIKAGKKTGKVRITALTASGKKVVFKLRIQSGKVKTKKIRIAKRTVRISVGETLALQPERYPITSKQKITYKSKNQSVAAVTKNGVIRGISEGTTRVVIYSGDCKLKVNVIVG